MIVSGGTAATATGRSVARDEDCQHDEQQRRETAHHTPLLIEARLLGIHHAAVSMIAKMISMAMAPT